MERRVQKIGDLNKHRYAQTGRKLERLSARTCRKLTKSTDIVCDGKSMRNEREREVSEKKVMKRLELSYQHRD